MSTQAVMEASDPYFCAFALTKGVEPVGLRRDLADGKHIFQYDAPAFWEVMDAWKASSVPADLRQYLSALRYVRSRMWGRYVPPTA